MRAQVDSLGSNAVQEVLAVQAENEHLKRDFARLNEFWAEELRRVKRSSDSSKHRYCDDFKKIMLEHEIEREMLRSDVQRLTGQLRRVNRRSDELTRQLETDSFSVPRLMNILNRNNSKVTNNWPRLQSLLEHFKDNTAPPSSWKTLISVTSVEDPFADVPAYVFSHDGDTDVEEKDDGPTGGDSPYSEVDLTRDDSAGGTPPRGATPTKKSPGKISSRKVPEVVQWRPTEWVESTQEVRAPDQKLLVTEEQGCASLAGLPAVWKKFRFGVQYAIRAGLSYSGAIQLLSSGEVAHSLFHSRILADRLASMMFWNQLDETPWTQHVPERHFLRPETRLEDLEQLNEVPAYWLPLTDVTANDAQEILDVVDSERYDETRDAAYDPLEEPPAQDDIFQSLKRRCTSTSSCSSVSPSRDTPASPVRRIRAGSLRKRSPLARKEYKALSPVELGMIENPGPRTTSWRHHGILTTFSPATVNAVDQTLGFPDYCPNKHGGTKQLKARWDLEAVKALLVARPWERMFAQRAKNLLLHRRSKLTRSVKTGLDDYVAHMERHSEAFWMTGHWLTMDLDVEGSIELHRHRKRIHDSASKTVETRKKKLLEDGAPPTLFHEPGVWSFPAKSCPWILMDPGTLNAKSKPFTLAEQLSVVDELEPARVQYQR